MPSLKATRKRIVSTKNTQKITRAMKMVAGARLTRAQQRITAMRPYAVKTAEVLRSAARTMAAEAEGEPIHPLLATRPEKKALVLVLSADRGLCGALNANIVRAAERTAQERTAAGVEVAFATLGRKGREFLTRRRANVVQDFPRIYEKLDLEKARLVTRWAVTRYLRGDFDAVYVIYSEFKSAITQKVVIDRLLPLSDAEAAPAPAGSGGPLGPTDFLFEPDQRSLLERLVPMYLEISVFRAMLDAQASFFGAQMTAMDAATRNAKEMIGRLTLVYNRARQAAITKELMEIIGGAEALKD